MKVSKLIPILFFFLAMAVIIGMSQAHAGKPKPPKPQPQQQEQGQSQKQDQAQHQGQEQSQHATASATASSDALANNEGNSLSVNQESGPADIVLVPQQHTANCMRTYGISFGNKEGGGGLGVPYRDRSCDLNLAATEAFNQQNYQLGWVLKCKTKNLQKAFGGEQECLAAVANPSIVKQLQERVIVLEDQKETLLLERQYDQERCKEESRRAHESCTRK